MVERFGSLAPAAGHLRHHARFYIAALAGLVVYGASTAAGPSIRLVLSGDLFFAAYLVLNLEFALRRAGLDTMRLRAEYQDEGVPIIVALTVAAIIFSLVATFSLLNRSGPADPVEAVLAIGSVPLGWATLHVLAAFHYAHRFYAAGWDASGGRRDAGGLSFPGTGEPTMGDFLYYAFVVGMTAQVSDVDVTDGGMRSLTLLHGLASFVFNTVIVALAVNVAVAAAR